MRAISALLAIALASGLRDDDSALPSADASPPPAGEDVRQDLMLLADDRPVLIVARIYVDGKPFRTAWRDAIGAARACLDRDGNGKLGAQEADAATIAAMVRLLAGTAAPAVNPAGAGEDGDISDDELAEALSAELGPLRLRADQPANGRTDALFDHLDRDKDGHLTEPELAAIGGVLRGLDRDDDEMISADEIERYRGRATATPAGTGERRARMGLVPSVVMTSPGESSLRLVRLLMRKYDKGRGDAPGPPDSKLSRNELAIPPHAFDEADANGDGSLSLEELRRYLERVPPDVALDVALPSGDSGTAAIRIGSDQALREGVEVRELGGGGVEVAIDHVRVEIRADDGARAADAARRSAMRRLSAADANKDGYLEEKEFNLAGGPMTPLAGLQSLIDRDADGKLYPAELGDFLDRVAATARGSLVLELFDHGRAIFGVVDGDRDRRLGAREVMQTVERVSTWDTDGDGRVAAEEIPYSFEINLGIGGLIGLPAVGPEESVPLRASSMATSGPRWFRRMDRNQDGDISRREFLGARDQFDKLDSNADGLIDASEATPR